MKTLVITSIAMEVGVGRASIGLMDGSDKETVTMNLPLRDGDIEAAIIRHFNMKEEFQESCNKLKEYASQGVIKI